MADTSSTSKVSRVRLEYSDLENVWKYNRDAYDNLGGFIDGSYLMKYAREETTTFDRRKECCWFPNFGKDIVTTLSGHLFKKDATRDYAGNTSLIAFSEKTNRKGDLTIQEFMKKVDVYSYVFGYCMLLVDKPEDIAINKAEEHETGMPYARIITPLEMLDWEMDDDGTFMWVKLIESYKTEADKPLGEHEIETRYRIWTRDGWAVYDEQDNIIKQGEHNLGRVPIIMVKHDESMKYKDIGTSIFTSIVQALVRLFNMLSERDALLRGATFSVLIYPTLDDLSKAAATNDTSDQKNYVSMGTDTIISFDPDSRHAPAFINPDGKTISSYNECIAEIVKYVQQLARLDNLGGAYVSGISMAIDFEKTNQALANKAGRLEDAEMSLYRLVQQWLSPDNSDDVGAVSVNYPDDYNIMDREKEIKNVFDMLLLDISEQFNKEVKKQASRQLMPELDDPTQKIIDAEIEEGVKPIDEFDDEGEE